MRIGLVACCKKKLDHPAPAHQLYQSPLFQMSVRWVKKHAEEWAILSAKHGLVMPDQELEPYDVSLGKMGREYRTKWRESVRKELLGRWGDSIFVVLAGAHYRRALAGLKMEDPIACWTQWRKDRGMSAGRAAMGMGLVMKALKEDWPYY
jgi:hypothetical protein